MTADPVSREIPLDDVLRFMRLIWAVDHELERVSKRMEDRIGLTIPQRLSLLLIGQNPGILASELAEVLHLHRGTLSGILRRLEHAGYIERTVDVRDAPPRGPDADAVRADREPAARRDVRGRGAPHAGVGAAASSAPRPSTCSSRLGSRVARRRRRHRVGGYCTFSSSMSKTSEALGGMGPLPVEP